MYNNDTELMFPPRVIPSLGGLRGVVWQKLVDEVSKENADFISQTGFTLLMVRMGGCQGCSIDSFRGMRGCTACAKQTVRRFRGSDQDLVNQYEITRAEVENFLQQI